MVQKSAAKIRSALGSRHFRGKRGHQINNQAKIMRNQHSTRDIFVFAAVATRTTKGSCDSHNQGQATPRKHHGVGHSPLSMGSKNTPHTCPLNPSVIQATNTRHNWGGTRETHGVGLQITSSLHVEEASPHDVLVNQTSSTSLDTRTHLVTSTPWELLCFPTYSPHAFAYFTVSYRKRYLHSTHLVLLRVT